MSVSVDSNAKFSEYAHPEVLVSPEWLRANLNTPGLIIVESDEDVLLYETGHIPGAVKIDWHTELNQPVMRDYLDGADFAKLLSSKGIHRDSTVVIYGDKSNWWAAYALWVFKLFGHEDVRLLDGGRDNWIASGLAFTRDETAITPSNYPVIERDDSSLRAFRDDVFKHFGSPLIDVRSPEEYSGERTHMPAYPDEGALRGGHIPSAASVPWAKAAGENGVFRSRGELEAIYLEGAGLKHGDNVIAYCRIGERSIHTWFVLKYLLGFTNVRNYDGSWTEWGSLVGAPIVKGTEPGIAPKAA
jgi:thiosulfate/3-mercaptopyruvate sulfurtransferase